MDLYEAFFSVWFRVEEFHSDGKGHFLNNLLDDPNARLLQINNEIVWLLSVFSRNL